MIHISVDFVLFVLAVVGFIIAEHEKKDNIAGLLFIAQIFVVVFCRLYLLFSGAA